MPRLFAEISTSVEVAKTLSHLGGALAIGRGHRVDGEVLRSIGAKAPLG